MDPDFIIGTAFVLLLTLIIGGIVLLFPVSRKLGALIEAHVQEKKAAAGGDPAAIGQLAARITRLEEQLRSIGERQEFVDRLLVDRTASVDPGAERQR